MLKIGDILFLVADTNIEHTLQGLMTRSRSLGIHSVDYNIVVHPLRDPGCWNDAHNFLRPFSRQYIYTMVLFDHRGSGQESRPIEELETELERLLAANGWDNRARVIVLEPELEAWVWSNSPKVAECLGWTSHYPNLQTWLREQGLLEENAIKPLDPKLALECVLYVVKKPRSASLYKQLASQVSLRGCTISSFNRFCSSLQEWFPQET